MTTWQGYIKGAEGGSIPIYKQIDYITILCRYRRIVKDARSWSGCTMPSDHRLVTMDIYPPKIHWYRQRATRYPAIDTDLLLTNEDVQRNFVLSVSANLPSNSFTANSWTEFGTTLQKIAKETIGIKPQRGHTRKIAPTDPDVKSLVEEVKKLRIDENAARTRSQKAAKRTLLRKKRKELSTTLKCKGRQHLEKKIAEVEEAKNDGRKMFAALKALNIRPQNALSITDESGKTIHDPDRQANFVTNHFKNQFSPNSAVPVRHQRTLQQPISAEEVQTAATKLKNHRACGPDSIPNELIKTACMCDRIAQWMASLLNTAVEGSIELSAIGAGTLIPLQKPNKPRGPLSSLRPVVLLNGIRKILSLILLERFRPYAETYVPDSQAGFRKGRSCTDIVFAKRLLCSTAIIYNIPMHFLCLDLSKAFDTPTRDLILESIQAACTNDEDIMQMTSTLLSNTNLRVRVKDVLGSPFKSTVGVPQGDSFSPVAFTTTFETVLQQTRMKFPPTPRTDIQLGIPMEMQYADDTDFVSTSHTFLEDIMNVLDTELPSHHFKCNREKTQRIQICKNNNEWRKSKTLGVLLDEKEDVLHRMQLANLAFRRMFSLFAGTGASLELKIRVWDALVRPVLLYGCGTWGLTASLTEKLCALHRSHLRVLAGYRWPKRIKNTALYQLTKTQPLSLDLRQARLDLLGHCLRMSRNSPAQLALDVSVNPALKGRRGRPPKCLLTTLREDAAKAGLDLRSVGGLEELRRVAADKNQWKEAIDT